MREHRRELEDLGLCTAADFNPANAESIVKRIGLSRDRASDHGACRLQPRTSERWADSPTNYPLFVYDVPCT